MTQKQRFALYLPTELRNQIDRWYTSDESTSINEFIIKTIQFYLSHLAANENNPLLPTAISTAIEGRLGIFEDRMARLLFKQAVDMVKHTNGRLSFRDITSHA